MSPFNIFIGYDPNEHAAYEVAMHSILRRTSIPVLIHPLSLDHLGHLVPYPVKDSQGKMWDPESNAPQSTEFARSRFCIPMLQKQGWALFIDCDMVINADIGELLKVADPRFAVQVVKHEYEPAEGTKMMGAIQTSYPRKNWSSVILWNCSHEGNWRLTHHRLNTWPGRDLHAFKWLDDSEIGDLPKEWNYLVGVNDISSVGDAKILHYTLGGPWFNNWIPQPLDEIWNAEQSYDRYYQHDK